jgi:polyisoprenoid-binding protein YceI
MRSLAILLATATLAGAAPAQTPPAPSPGTAVVEPGVVPVHLKPEQIPAGTYEVNTKETLVRYTVDHLGFSDFWGTFPGATGTLAIDPKNLAGTKLDVKVPIALVETTNRELDGELFSDEFFDAENYPWMHFVATALTRTGPTTARLVGELTMHDVTRPLALDVTFHGAGPSPFDGKGLTIGFDATGTVKRSDFGLGKYAPLVSDEVRITISAEFKQR